MKSSGIILLAMITVLLVVIAAELAILIGSSNAGSKLAASSNQELVDSNNRLEAVMADVGDNLEMVVNKFCGGKKKK